MAETRFVRARRRRSMCILVSAIAVALFASLTIPASLADEISAADAQAWRLPTQPVSPKDNEWTPARSELGKMLFFDPRLSGSGQVTCASCHLPERGWSDGLPTAVRFLGQKMRLATPSLINIGYNTIFMWDGRQPTLEQQGLGGQGEAADINAGSKIKPAEVVRNLSQVSGYIDAFEKVYPGEGITPLTLAKALAAFQRSLIARESPFDRWLAGDTTAMNARQLKGFKLFLDPQKGACAACHQPPNFTDNGFHNLGLASHGEKDPLPGRGKHRNIPIMDGAFKTPALRDVALTAPYFHDGSARTLAEVVDHYIKGGEVTRNLSPSFRKAILTPDEKADLIAFLEALTTPPKPFVYPVLPR
jgi:cytochrome c peroxidase